MIVYKIHRAHKIKTYHLDERHVHVFLNLNFFLWILCSPTEVLGRHPCFPKRGKYFYSTQICSIIPMLTHAKTMPGRVKTLWIKHTTPMALFQTERTHRPPRPDQLGRQWEILHLPWPGPHLGERGWSVAYLPHRSWLRSGYSQWSDHTWLRCLHSKVKVLYCSRQCLTYGSTIVINYFRKTYHGWFTILNI